MSKYIDLSKINNIWGLSGLDSLMRGFDCDGCAPCAGRCIKLIEWTKLKEVNGTVY